MSNARKKDRHKLPALSIFATNATSTITKPYAYAKDNYDPLTALACWAIHTVFLPAALFGSGIKSAVDIATRNPLTMLEAEEMSYLLQNISTQQLIKLADKIISYDAKSEGSKNLILRLLDYRYDKNSPDRLINQMREDICTYVTTPKNQGKKLQISIYTDLLIVFTPLHTLRMIAMQLASAVRSYTKNSETYVGAIPVDVLKMIVSMTDQGSIDDSMKKKAINDVFSRMKKMK